VPWHAAKLRLTRVFFPLGFVALVRAGSPDPPVLCDRRPPCPRPSARHLETYSRPKGDCSLSAASVNRRGPPSMPRAEPVTALPTRQGVNMLRKAPFHGRRDTKRSKSTTFMMRERSALWTRVVGKWEPRDVKRERPNQRNGQGTEDKAVRNPGLPLLAHREAV